MSEVAAGELLKEADEFNAAGNCAFKDKEYEKAIRFYNYAINKCPKESRYFANRSAAFLGMGDRSRALQDAERVIEMSPTWYKGYSRKASVYLYLRKYKDCIETCKIALSLDPNNEALLEILSRADKAISHTKADDFSALEDAEAMSDDGESTAEGISRLQKIRQQKTLEDFLAKVNVEFKPVIDTEKDRHVSDHAILELTAKQHVERLSGKNAFWKNLNPFRVLMLPETASDEDIRQRYLKLAGMIHPDKCTYPGARIAFEAVLQASEILKDPKRKEECVHLIKGATKSVVKRHERLIEKGMNPDALPDIEIAIEEEIMKVFAQNEQRQRKAKQYFNLYERREKERVGKGVNMERCLPEQEEKRKKLVEEVKERHEWNEGINQRVDSWREYQKKEATKRKQLTSDDMSGETDHDKRRKQEDKAYYTALGEEYKLKWR